MAINNKKKKKYFPHITERFEENVRGAVLDGIITQEEEKALMLLAEEENIPEHEAVLYISYRLKKRIINQERGKSFKKGFSIVGSIALKIGIPVLTAFVGRKFGGIIKK